MNQFLNSGKSGTCAPVGPTAPLRIVPQQDQQNLSKGQKLFNTLVKKIEASRHDLAQWQAMMDTYRQKVASDYLIPRLKEAGYVETGATPGLFKHVSNSIVFALVVDDFFVQYTDMEDFNHLADTLKKHYDITTDMTASKFCGITLDWNYEEGHVTLSMPGYVAKALQRFTHPDPRRPQHAPHPWTAPNYGASIQYADPEDDSKLLDKHGTKRLQEVVGTFLFYGRAVDNTMLTALSTIASAQTQGTEKNHGCTGPPIRLCSNPS